VLVVLEKLLFKHTPVPYEMRSSEKEEVVVTSVAAV